MPKSNRKNGLSHLTNLVLRHSPGASIELLAAITTDWGQLYDDQRLGRQDSIDIEGGTPNGYPNSPTDVSAPS
jgi:hypothetical protein